MKKVIKKSIREFLKSQDNIYIRKYGSKSHDTIEQMYEYVVGNVIRAGLDTSEIAFTMEHLRTVVSIIMDPVYIYIGDDQLRCFDQTRGLCIPITEMLVRIIDHDCFQNVAFQISQMDTQEYEGFCSHLATWVGKPVPSISEGYIPLGNGAFHIKSETMVPYKDLKEKGFIFPRKIKVNPIELTPTEISEKLKGLLSENKDVLREIQHRLTTGALKEYDAHIMMMDDGYLKELGKALLLAVLQTD